MWNTDIIPPQISKSLVSKLRVFSLYHEIHFFLEVSLDRFSELKQWKIERPLEHPENERMHSHIIPELPANIRLLDLYGHISSIM